MTQQDPAEYGRRSVLKTTGALLAGAASGGIASARPGGRGRGKGRGRTADQSVLRLDGSFPPLDAGVYEGWAIFGSEKVSTGRFAADEAPVFAVDRDLTAADKIVVTIEPEPDDDPGPSGVVYLAGEVERHGNEATATLEFPVSVDPAEHSATYILATPTDGPNSNETAGVWYIDPRNGGPSAGLDLPALPAGWVYEGWAVTQGTPISTGRFDDLASADSHADFSGPNSGPPFPGEDLLQNAPAGVEFPADLADGESKLVVSIEPDIDGVDPTGDAPFHLKPVRGAVPEDLTDHTPADLGVHELDREPVTAEVSGQPGIPHRPSEIELDLSELPALGHDAVYEGWAIFGDEKDSIGRFERGDYDDVITLEHRRDMRFADVIAITIEPRDERFARGRRTTPSGTVILKGAVAKDGDVDLSFPVDFADSAGTYILATPTNGPASYETAGVWFLDPRDGGPSAGLDLPALPAGWVYEGWAVTQGRPITTGQFRDPAMPDDFDGFSGDQGGPPFPGEDLLQNAPAGVEFPADLADGASAVVITVEPDLDVDESGPFPIKPLVGQVPAGLDDHTPAEMGVNEDAGPTGSGSITRK